jgi:hypothetical protein
MKRTGALALALLAATCLVACARKPLITLPPEGYDADSLEVARRVEVVQFMDTCLAHLQAHEYEKLARLFHTPPDTPPAEAHEEIEFRRRQLAYLSQTFGDLQDPALLNEKCQTFSIGVDSGDNEYWHAYPVYRTGQVMGDFELAGPAVLTFTVVRITGRWELRKIEFGVFSYDPAARAWLSDVIRGLTEIPDAG